jgi:hypothetical protein
MNTKQIKAVLYSVSQGCFHLETLEDYIKNNLENCLAGKSLDYRLIGVFETDKEADRFISRFDNWLKIVKETDDITSSLLN